LIPDESNYELHLVVEQKPERSNRITLSPERKDTFDCPLAVIDWHISSSDLRTHRAIYRRFATQWRVSNFASLACLVDLPLKNVYRQLFTGGGIYHPGGSIRIGTGPQNGVVDNRLQTFRVPKLWVVSTAVFPSGGGANPTLTLMLFALRAADDIIAQMKRYLSNTRPVPEAEVQD
jgi:choline dehydrogenase-like flavoprotein